ncbi:MAG: flagellar hook-basal body complex protein FliE [Candidatus Wallbacteria bacterium]
MKVTDLAGYRSTQSFGSAAAKKSAMKSSQDENKQSEGLIESFSDVLQKAINDLGALEADSSRKTNDMLTGKLDNVHDLTIAMEKAKIGLSLALEVRNKALESYKEIMRMQI